MARRTQRDDLVQAIESLRQTTRKINVTSRDLFREAFTAVSLHLQAEPFGLLDEVDASLAEVNNERFVRLVRQITSDTQFIITHWKRTMEAAEALYGVTMEAGCSRLVSVSFARMEA